MPFWDEYSASTILSNNSTVNVYGGTIANTCEYRINQEASLYAIESHKPSETNGLVISYKANEFDEDRAFGTEIIANRDVVFVSPVAIGSDYFDYTGVVLTKEITLKVNKLDTKSVNLVSKNISGLSGSRKITLSYQVYGKSGAATPTGTIKIVDKINGNEAVIAESLPVTGSAITYNWNVGIDAQFDVDVVYSGDEYYREVTKHLNIDTSKQLQSITIDLLIEKVYGDDHFIITATSADGDTVILLSSDNSILSFSGSTATIHKAGTVTCSAIVAENLTHNGNTTEFTVKINRKNITFKAEDKAINQ